MKKWFAWLLLLSLIWLSAVGCGSQKSADTDPKAEESTEAPAEEIEKPIFDPYATENIYKYDDRLTEKQKGTDYGTLVEDVKYYSKTAGDYKHCNVLLPPGYDKTKKYPVLYMLHGWTSDYDVHLSEDSYLYLLYGNMFKKKLTVRMVIVAVEMYTAKHTGEDPEDMDEAELLAAYNKVVEDIPNDLMPYIEKHYAVRTDRIGTAIMGVSQGGTKALATGFKYLDRFGYIGCFAPDPGTIPTNFLKGTIWNKPLIKGFPEYDEKTAPYYLYLAVGSDDPENVEVTKYYGKVLTKMGYKNQTDVAKGYEHDSQFWRVCFYNFMRKIFRK